MRSRWDNGVGSGGGESGQWVTLQNPIFIVGINW